MRISDWSSDVCSSDLLDISLKAVLGDVTVRFDAPGKAAALAQFQQRYREDALVTDKWITLVASRPQPEAIDDVRDLLASPWWLPTNPNRVRAVLGSSEEHTSELQSRMRISYDVFCLNKPQHTTQ